MTYTMTYSTTPSIKSGKDQPTRVKLWDNCNPEKFVDCIDITQIAQIESKLDLLATTPLVNQNELIRLYPI